MCLSPGSGVGSGCVCWMLVQREANTITNKVLVRAWPDSMQSAHFPHGECLAVRQCARGSAAKNQGRMEGG